MAPRETAITVRYRPSRTSANYRMQPHTAVVSRSKAILCR